MILSLLFVAVVAVVALEAFLLLGRDLLPDARRRSALEASLRQAQGDLQEAKRRIEAARAGLMAAIESADRQRSALREADQTFAESQKVMPALIHTVGEARVGRCFRAPLGKELPPVAEPSQQTIWACQNFIDVWADDAEMAHRLAARQFNSKHGYAIGDFDEIGVPAAVPAQRAAA